MPEKKKILVLYTGGTIGMHGPPWKAGSLEDLRKNIPDLEDLPYEIDYQECFDRRGKPIDSSDANAGTFNYFAKEIAKAQGEYKGVVMLYGTDTMAPAAGSLSYQLEGLKMPVIFTGSMRAASVEGSDGPANLIDSIHLVAKSGDEIPPINEVAICFGKEIFKGTNSFKYSANSDNDHPIKSVDGRVLGKISNDGEIDLNEDYLLKEPDREFELHEFSRKNSVMAINLNNSPGMRIKMLEGNISLADSVFIYGGRLNPNSDMQRFIEENNERSIPVFYSGDGEVPDPSWGEGSHSLHDFQQAMAKITYINSLTKDPKEAKQLFEANLRGEIEGPIVRESEILRENREGEEYRSEFSKR